MKNQIKEVNGVKVIKRFGTGAILSAVFCLLLVAIPVTMIFIPWLKVTVTDGTDTVVVGLTAIDMIGKVFIGALTGTGSDFIRLLVQLGTDSSQVYMPYVALIAAYAIPVLYALVAFFAIFFLFFALELLFRGRMHRFKAPYVLSWFYFLFVTFFAGLGIGLQLFITFIYSLISSPTYTLAFFPWSSYLNYIYIGVSLVSLIALGIIYSAAFKNKIFIGDIGDLSRANQKVEGNAEPAKEGITNDASEELIKKVVQTPAIGLPPTIKNIGGHAFSENQNLIVAIVPLGVKALGRGAFANCGHLKLVSLPLSLKSIGTNCFFNCANLQRINYAGTKEQWRHVRRGSNWLTKAGIMTVVCVDGPIIVNPYH